ncbi:unnamed protein product [Musa acuminata subsp. burmannicoides]
MGLTGTCIRTFPLVEPSPHMLMTKVFIRCKIRCTPGRPASAVPWPSLLESIALLAVVLFTEVELPVAPDHTSI